MIFWPSLLSLSQHSSVKITNKNQETNTKLTLVCGSCGKQPPKWQESLMSILVKPYLNDTWNVSECSHHYKVAVLLILSLQANTHLGKNWQNICVAELPTKCQIDKKRTLCILILVFWSEHNFHFGCRVKSTM